MPKRVQMRNHSLYDRFHLNVQTHFVKTIYQIGDCSVSLKLLSVPHIVHYIFGMLSNNIF